MRQTIGKQRYHQDTDLSMYRTGILNVRGILSRYPWNKYRWKTKDVSVYKHLLVQFRWQCRLLWIYRIQYIQVHIAKLITLNTLVTRPCIVTNNVYTYWNQCTWCLDPFWFMRHSAVIAIDIHRIQCGQTWIIFEDINKALIFGNGGFKTLLSLLFWKKI